MKYPRKIDSIKLKGKLVLLRIDINSPVVEGKVVDNARFDEAAESIKYLLNKKAKLAILAHQGRKGDRDFTELEQHAKILSRHLMKKIKYVPDLFGHKAASSIEALKEGEAILLENVREYKDEFDSSGGRFNQLSKKFDIYVNDAFSVSHREQASIMIPPKIIPGYMGINLSKEIDALRKFKIKNGRSVFLIGGAKVKDYIPLFDNLKNKDASVLASGILANILLVSKGENLGYENIWLNKNRFYELIPELKKIVEKYTSQIILPIDFALGKKDVEKTKNRTEKSILSAPFKEKIWDLGEESILEFKSKIKKADFIFMKGPLGYSENKLFSKATVEILKTVSLRANNRNVTSILGGGHLTTTMQKYRIKNNFSHISTSGGALIAYLSGKKLPGIEALR